MALVMSMFIEVLILFTNLSTSLPNESFEIKISKWFFRSSDATVNVKILLYF